MYARTLYYIHENERLKRSFRLVICKGTRFFDNCNPSVLFFSCLIRFLINRIGYPLRNKLFLPQTPLCTSRKTQDLNDRLD